MSESEMRLVELPVEEIVVEGRHRRNYSGIEELAESIGRVGLLQPILVTHSKRLIAGGRRLAAYRLLGKTTISANMVSHLEEVCALLIAEAEENTCRQSLLPSEAVSLAEALIPLEEEAARKRMTHQEGGASGNLPQAGRALDKIAHMVGMSRRTLDKARKIVAAAKEDPRRYGDLVEKMDAKGKIHGVYRELHNRQFGEEVLPESVCFAVRMDPRGKFKLFGDVSPQDVIAHLKSYIAFLEKQGDPRGETA